MPHSLSFIRGSTHLINILNQPSVQSEMLFCTLDVTHLYTNIPHNESIQAINEMLTTHRPPHDLPHSSYIVQLLEVAMTNNYFQFNGKYYHQVLGTAMDTKLAPSYANLFITKFGENYVYPYPPQPALWKRFTEDIFLIWPHGIEPSSVH